MQRYIAAQSGLELDDLFAQYLTQSNIPVFEYRFEGNTLHYRWADVIPGFAMPVDVTVASGRQQRLQATTSWQRTTVGDPRAFEVDRDWYVNVRAVTP